MWFSTWCRQRPSIGSIVAKLQGKVTKFLLIRDPQTRPQTQMPDFAEEALGVLLQLEYKRAEAEAMIAGTLEAAPQIRDAESLLAEVYRRLRAAQKAS